jgi:heme-degrading monooxygenase HmoA
LTECSAEGPGAALCAKTSRVFEAVSYEDAAMSQIASTPKPPYYAVIFTSIKSEDHEGYAEMAEQMATLAARQPGYLGMETARDGIGITVSYWESLDAIENWKRQADHQQAQRLGRERWYQAYRIRISKVEREYGQTLQQ